MHRYHPDPDTNDPDDALLWDNCERCSELAANPFTGLDYDRLRRMVDLARDWMRDRAVPRTDTEFEACRVIEDFLLKAARAREAGVVL